MKKEIEEMARDLPFLTLERDVHISSTNIEKRAWTLSEEDNKIIAEAYYNAGYRKTAEPEVRKCDCYNERIERHYFNDFERGWNASHGIYDKYKERVISYCVGTRECDPCSCDGDKSKCDFYEEVRRKARKEINKYEQRN